ncbi:MAG TPA: PQQ-binding-like beta-propeller repeat protein [Bacillota bacterium]|nr:PQQ-binding-like beta-propeller repeat protein [Bacillota bacterium]
MGVLIVAGAGFAAYHALGRGLPRTAPAMAAPATATAAAAAAKPPASKNGLPLASFSPSNPPQAWPGPLPYPILIADSNNNRIIEVTPDKRIVWQYPTAATTAESKSYGTTGDDSFFTPDGTHIVTNDEEKGTIIRINFYTGQVDWHFGVPGQLGGGSTHLNYPDDAYVLPNGNTIAADIRNCREVTISPDAQMISSWGKPQTGYCQTDPSKGLFGYPNGDTPQSNGDILVSFISGDRIALLSPTGQVIWNVPAPDLYGGYVSDAQLMPNGDVLVAGYGKPGMVVEFNPQTGKVDWQYRVTSGNGELDHPSLALPLPNGNILLNDDANNRVIVIDPKTNQIVWQYGTTGVAGTSAGLLNWPDGVDVDMYHDWLHFLPAATSSATSN